MRMAVLVVVSSVSFTLPLCVFVPRTEGVRSRVLATSSLLFTSIGSHIKMGKKKEEKKEKKTKEKKKE